MRCTRRAYVCAIGNSSRPPIRKPSMPPPGPPRISQSSIRTSQPTPIMVPKPKVKYSTVVSPPRSVGVEVTGAAIRARTIAGAGVLHAHAKRRRMAHVTNQPRPSFTSPRFAQPATFMRLPYVDDPAGLDVALVGVPYDGGTSYRPGARLGPREIRNQSSLIRGYNYFQKVSPFDRLNVADVGDVDAPPVSIEKAYAAIEARIGAIADAGARPIVIGGDHSITLPVLRALAARRGRLGLVQVDAHLDTWDEYFGGKYFHGTPFRRAIEEGLIDGRRFVQVGIRGPMYGENDFDFHREHAITMIDIDQVKDRGLAAVIADIRRLVTGPAYLTFDIDGVDPAFAPGTGTPEVGGLTSHEALRLVRGLRGLAWVGGDIVEVAPVFDGPGQITAVLAANIAFEFLCAMA